MNDDCRDTIAFLDDYVDGTCADAEREVFERHLARCPYCRDYLKSYRETISLSRGAATTADEQALAEPPRELVDAIVDTIASARRGGDKG